MSKLSGASEPLRHYGGTSTALKETVGRQWGDTYQKLKHYLISAHFISIHKYTTMFINSAKMMKNFRILIDFFSKNWLEIV